MGSNPAPARWRRKDPGRVVGGAEPAGRFEMPSALQDRSRMPLWNDMFERHNVRFFRAWIGPWYLLIPPLGSLPFLLLTVTGDWLVLTLLQRRSNQQHSHRL